MIETMGSMRTMMLTMHSTMSGIFDQMDEMSENAKAMGHAFDAAKNDDSFYLPPEVFKNADFKRAMKSFLSPDGHAARFIILHRRDPASAEGIASIDAIHTAAEESLKGTPLEDCQDLPGRHGRRLQRHLRGRQMGPGDRRNLLALPDFHHHAGPHPGPRCRRGHRGDGRGLTGRLVRAVRAGLAAHSRYPVALAGAWRCPSSCCWPWGRTTTCCWSPGSNRRYTPA